MSDATEDKAIEKLTRLTRAGEVDWQTQGQSWVVVWGDWFLIIPVGLRELQISEGVHGERVGTYDGPAFKELCDAVEEVTEHSPARLSDFYKDIAYAPEGSLPKMDLDLPMPETKPPKPGHYPAVEKAGLKVTTDAVPGAPPGVLPEDLNPYLREMGLLEKWHEWACGITAAGNGVYVWDVEDFLSGRPNLD